MSTTQTWILIATFTAVFFWKELLSGLLDGLLFVLRPIRDWIERKKLELEDLMGKDE